MDNVLFEQYLTLLYWLSIILDVCDAHMPSQIAAAAYCVLTSSSLKRSLNIIGEHALVCQGALFTYISIHKLPFALIYGRNQKLYTAISLKQYIQSIGTDNMAHDELTGTWSCLSFSTLELLTLKIKRQQCFNLLFRSGFFRYSYFDFEASAFYCYTSRNCLHLMMPQDVDEIAFRQDAAFPLYYYYLKICPRVVLLYTRKDALFTLPQFTIAFR
jgi:hypothetical protein